MPKYLVSFRAIQTAEGSIEVEAETPQQAIDEAVTDLVPVKGFVVRASKSYLVNSEALEVEPVVVQELRESGPKTVWREGDDE